MLVKVTQFLRCSVSSQPKWHLKIFVLEEKDSRVVMPTLPKFITFYPPLLCVCFLPTWKYMTFCWDFTTP